MAEGLTYAERLQLPQWQKKRLEILQRDKWRCCVCGNDKDSLHVHHKEYLPSRDPWDYSDDNFETLCKACHKKEHTLELLRMPENFVMPHITDYEPEIISITCEIDSLMGVLKNGDEKVMPYLNFLIKQRNELRKSLTADK